MYNKILDGLLDGYKLKIDKKESSIFLCKGEQKKDIKNKIAGVKIKSKSYNPKYMTCIIDFKNIDNYFFNTNEDIISGLILIDFKSYLKLLIYGLCMSPQCLGIKNL